MSTTVAGVSTVPPEPFKWNRTGAEQLKLVEDEALLSGWHDVIRWFLTFLLSTPKDAMFLRRLNNKTDMIETMDLYLQYEPQVFLVTFSGLVYTVTGFFGSVVYVVLRRRKRCGGDLTQDINENMRCVLQVYTAAYIVVLAGILLGSLLMLASLFELGQSVAAEGNNFPENLREVEYYIRNASQSQIVDNQRRVDVLATLINKLQKNFEDMYTTFAVPHVKAITSAKVSGEVMMLGMAAEMPPEIEEQQEAPSQAGVPPEEYMARFMAGRVAQVYNHTITDTVALALETSALASDFSRMLSADAARTVPGFDQILPALEQADALGVLKTLRSESKSYVIGIVGSFSVLFVLYSGSFIMGMFYYNEGVAPTKRSASSNYAGLAMLLAVVLSFPICSILMLVTVSVMLVALTLTNYVCRPYDNIIYDTADITQTALLDDTMRVIWPRETRGKWFGKFLAGSTLTICNGGRMLEVIKGDYQDSVKTLVDLTEIIQQLLLSLTVDPRLIFSVDHPELPFFAKMKSQLWDHVDKITELFILEIIINDINDLVHTKNVGNPPCFAAYKGYEKALGVLCRGIIRNVNAFWTALGFCLWMFLVLGTVSHFLSKYFLRMVNWTYDGSEVESYTSSSSSGSSSSKSGGSSPKTGAEKPEGAPPDHPDAAEAKGEGAESQKEGPNDDLKDTQTSAMLGPKSAMKDAKPLPRWLTKKRKSIANIGAGTLQRMRIEGEDDEAAAASTQKLEPA